MKLSDKGWHKIVLAESMLDDPDLDQSDFEGVVVLSVKEAKKLMHILHENAPYLDCLYEASKADYIFLEEISKRIEQADMSMPST